LVPSFFTVAVIAVFFEPLSTEIFSGRSVVSFTPAGAASIAFPPLLLPGPWSSAEAVKERTITAEKDAVSSDPAMVLATAVVMVVARRELMFVPLVFPCIPLRLCLNSQYLKRYHKISPHYAGTA